MNGEFFADGYGRDTLVEDAGRVVRDFGLRMIGMRALSPLLMCD